MTKYCIVCGTENFSRSKNFCCVKCAQKFHYQKNKPQRAEYKKQYYQEHKEEFIDRSKKWLENNREKWNEYVLERWRNNDKTKN